MIMMRQKTNQMNTIVQEIVIIMKREQRNRKNLQVDVSNVVWKATKALTVQEMTVQQKMRQLMNRKLINNMENMVHYFIRSKNNFLIFTKMLIFIVQIKSLSKKNARNTEVMKENMKIILKQYQKIMYLVVLHHHLHTSPRKQQVIHSKLILIQSYIIGRPIFLQFFLF